MESIRKRILYWLFGTDDIKEYVEILVKAKTINESLGEEYEAHMQTLYEAKEDLNTLRKLIRVCENHGIDVDKEIKQIKL